LNRFLHLADLHLGWYPAFLPEALAGRRQAHRDDTLRRAVDFALHPSSRIALVVIAGDLFDHFAPDGPLAGAVMGQLARLTRAGVAVVTVPGNHDEITYAKSIFRARGSEWPGLLVTNPAPGHTGTLTISGTPVHVYGVAYTGGVTDARQPMRAFPPRQGEGFHLAVFHGTLTESARLGERSLPLSPSALAAAGYDYVALGHVHEHRELRLGAAQAAYAGAVEGKGFDDPGCACWTVVDVTRGAVRLMTVAADTRPLETRTYDASSLSSPSALAAVIESWADPAACLRARIVGRPPFTFDAGEIAARLAPRFFHLNIEDATTALPPEQLAAWAGERTVLGEFVRRLQEQIAQTQGAEERDILEQALKTGVAALRSGGRP